MQGRANPKPELSLKELKDLLDDNEIDLSARGLEAVPKALLQLPRATKIDLSGNKIASVPRELCNMTKITRLELGKNQIKVLPDNFGNLVNLQHLDLYDNKIEELPVSFSNLKSLKWLDLKKNPLDAKLSKAAGNCGSEKECKKAAISVVEHMKNVQLEIHQLVTQQEKVNRKIQEEKAHQKNQKKQAAKAAKPTNQPKQKENTGPSESPAHKKPQKPATPEIPKSTQSNNSPGMLRKLLRWTFLLALAVVGFATIQILMNCANGGNNWPGAKALCNDLNSMAQFKKPSDKFLQNVKNTYGVYFNRMKRNVQPHIDSTVEGAQYYYAEAVKSDFGKKTEKFFYDAHAFVVEKLLLTQRFFSQQWTSVQDWYAREGEKTFGTVVENVRISCVVIVEIAKDVALIAYEGMLKFYHRAEDFVITCMDKGFSKALEKIL